MSVINKRFIEYTYRKGWKNFKKNKNTILDAIKANFLVESNKGRIYDFMQAAGRYYSFIELSSSHEENFEEEILAGNVDESLIGTLNKIYQFLSANTSFDEFVRNIEELDCLLKNIDDIISE